MKNPLKFIVASLVVSLLFISTSNAQENQPPTTQSQFFEIDPEQELTFSIIASDPDDDDLIYSVVTLPTHGEITGKYPAFVYIPNLDYNGIVTLVYTISDGEFTTAETTITFSIGLTYCKIYPYILKYDQFTDVENGTVFTEYRTATGTGNYSLLNWNGENDANTLAASFAIPGNSENYTNPDDPNDFTIDVNDWVQGTPGKNNANQVRDALDLLIGETVTLPLWSQTRKVGSNFDYQVAGFANIELSEYQLNGNSFISFIYQGTERCLNYAPVTYDNNFEAETQTPITIAISTEDDFIDEVTHLLTVYDQDGDELTYIITQPPIHGTLIGEGPEFIYTSNADYEGVDEFGFKVNDSKADSNISTISINIINPNVAPIADEQNITTNEDQNTNITLTASDVNGDGLSYQIITQPVNGILSGATPNLIYIPNINFNGNDSFNFIANDGELDSQTTTINITITPVNDTPIAIALNATTAEDTPVNVTLSGTDVENDTLTYSIVTQPINGTLTGIAPNLTYTPNANYNGTDTFTYIANDGALESQIATATITIEAVNDAPVVNPATINTDEDQAVSITLSGTDVDGDSLSYVIDAQPADGTLSGSGNIYSYTPNENYNGIDSFTYHVTDGNLNSATVNITLNVNAINDQPIATELSLTTEYQTAVIIPFTATDIEDSDLTFQVQNQPQNGIISEDSGDFTYQPNDGFSGTDSFNYVAIDSQGLTSQPVVVNITVQEGNNQPPEITSTAPTNAFAGSSYQYATDAVDPNGDELTYSLNTAPQDAVIDPATGLIEWTINPEYSPGLSVPNTQCFKEIIQATDDLEAEFIIMVDGSRSLQDQQKFIPTWLPSLSGELLNQGIGLNNPNQFGLSLFTDDSAPVTFDDDALFADMQTVIDSMIPSGKLRRGGVNENLILSLDMVLDEYPLSSDKRSSILFITDEACEDCPNDPQATQAVIERLLAQNIVLHGMVDDIWTGVDFIIQCGNGQQALGMTADGTGYFANDEGYFEACENAELTEVSTNVLEHHIGPVFATGGSVWDLKFIESEYVIQNAMAEAMATVMATSTAKQTNTVEFSDLYFSSVDVNTQNISLEITNRGLQASGSARLRVLSNDTEITSELIPVLAVSETIELIIDITGYDLNSLRLEIITDDPDNECDLTNNSIKPAYFDWQVSDTEPLSDDQQFIVTVSETNQPPVITAYPQVGAQTGIPYTAQVIAEDQNKGDALRYELVSGGHLATIDAFTGLFIWLPEVNSGTDESFSVLVTDLAGATDQVSFTISIEILAERFNITSLPIRSVLPGADYEYTLETNALPTAVLDYRLLTNPEEMTISNTGVISWNAPVDIIDQFYLVVAQVVDSYGNSDVQSYLLTVENDLPQAPYFQINNPSQLFGVGGLYETIGYVKDNNALEIFDFQFLRKPEGMTIYDDLVWGQPPANYTSAYKFLIKWYDAISLDLESLHFTNHWLGSDDPTTTNLSASLEKTIDLGFEINSKFSPNLLVTSLNDSNQNGSFDPQDKKSLIYAETGGIRAISGNDFSQQWFYPNLIVPDVRSSSGRNNALAVADIDNDLRREVIVLDNNGYLNILSSEGELLRTTTEPIDTDLFRTSVKAIDLDADGNMELLVGNKVYNTDGSFRFEMTKPYWLLDWHYEATAIDVDQDGVFEVLYNNTMYNQDGSVRITDLASGSYFAPLNADSDPQLEWFQVGNKNSVKTASLYDHDGTELWSYNAQYIIKPAIADIDQDGVVEIVLGFDSYELNGERIQQNSSSRQMHSYLTDLNGDGAYELALEYNKLFRLYDPITRELLWNWNKPIGQNQSLVADIDNDGSAELLYVYAQAGRLKLDIIGASQGQWKGVLSEVNQSVDNAWMSNPVTNQPQLTYNVYTGQLFENSIKPDLHVTGPQIRGQIGAYQLFAEITNQTPSMYQGKARVAFYNDEILPENLLGVAEINDLGMNAKKRANLDRIFQMEELSDTLVAQLIDLDDEDMDPNNNSASSEMLSMMAIDLTGLVGESTYTLRALEFNYQPHVPHSYSLPDAIASQLYQQTIPVDYRPGYFMLYGAPEGLSLSTDGVVQWAPAPDQIGEHELQYVLVDPSRANINNMRTLSIQVDSGSNLPPVFDSEAHHVITLGESLNFQVSATDPEGTAVRYEMINEPYGTLLDASGVLSWDSSTNGLGLVQWILRAIDADNGFTDQYFTVLVNNTNNMPPVITSTPGELAGLNRNYKYQLSVVDDSPQLIYNLINSPVDMTVNAQGMIEWVPNNIGMYQVTIEVTDGEFSAQQQWTIEVPETGADINGTIVFSQDVISYRTIQDIRIVPIGTVGSVSISATLNDVPLNLSDQFEVSIEASTLGISTVQAVITDDLGSITIERDFEVVSFVNEPPVVDILTPPDGGIITGFADVQIRVQDSTIQTWRLSYRRGMANPTQDINGLPRTILAEGTANVNDAVVAEFDTSLLKNGIYVLILEAVDIYGGASSVTNSVFLEGDLKLGHFQIAFEDLNIPVAGIPVTISRSYDTRDRNQDRDFGKGWSIGHQALELTESRIPGQGWYMETEFYNIGPLRFPRYCVEPIGKRLVSVRMPDGKLDKFHVKAKVLNPSADGRNECQDFIPPDLFTVEFIAQGNTTSSLSSDDINESLRIISGNLETLTSFAPIDPNKYTLTLLDGTIYQIDQGFNLTEIETTDGNSIKFTHNGITHGNGFALSYIRDTQDRIITIQKPNGDSIDYSYNVNGDLASHTDLRGNTTTFNYIQDHYLQDINDPSGVRVARNEYDTDGRLVAHIDANGNRIEYTHDIAGRTETIKNRLGHASVFVYDNQGSVIAETNPLGETTYHEYDQYRLETKRINPLGYETSWTYDQQGNQLTETDALGRTTNSSYNNRGELLSQTDSSGNVVITNEYSNPDNPFQGGGNLASVTDALGQTTQFHWTAGLDADLNTVVVNTGFTDANGNRYDLSPITGGTNSGLSGSSTDLNGLKTETTYDNEARPLSETQIITNDSGIEVARYTTTMVYNANGDVIQTTDALGHSSFTEYNQLNKVSVTIDAAGNRTTYEFDTRGNPTMTTYPDGTFDSQSYDAEGQMILSTDRAGRTTTNIYDAAGRVVKVTASDGSFTTNDYDVGGRLSSVTDALGNMTSYEYDSVGNNTKVTDSLGNSTFYTYDLNNRRISSTDALGHKTEFIYDLRDNLTDTILPDSTPLNNLDNPIMSVDYDARSRKLTEMDLAGSVTQYEYNPDGLITAVIDSLGNRTEYTYDQRGNKTSQKDAKGNITSWSYNALSQLVTHTLPEGQSQSFAYNAVGNQISKTEFNGDTTIFDYNSIYQLINVTYGDGSIETQSYYPSGLVSSITNAQGTSSYVYDSQDRVITETKLNGDVITYAYDIVGNKIQTTISKGTLIKTWNYEYDVLNRLSKVTDDQLRSYMTEYNAIGLRSKITQDNGVYTTYYYDEQNRLMSQSTYNSSDVLISSYTYTLSPTGLRLQIYEQGGKISSYAYDELYRMESENIIDPVNGNHNATFSFDAVGNRTQSVINGITTGYSYDNNDLLLSAGAINYQYNANGSLIVENNDGQVTQYSYDKKNQLTEMIKGIDTYQYQYDRHGIRTSSSINGDVTEYLIDHNQTYSQVLLETSAIKQTIYTYGDDLLAQENNTGVFFFHYDGLGSTRQLTDSTQTVTDEYNYDSYGNLLAQTGVTENNYLFTGEQYDPNMGFYYLRARYMNPEIGRFTSMDTYAGNSLDPVSLNKYLYANSDPINHTDPTGNFSIGSLMSALNVAAITSSYSLAAYDVFTFIISDEPLTAKQAGLLILSIGSPKLLTKMFKAFKFCNSFDGETLVLTESGLKPISEIEIGEMVWTYNEDSKQKTLEEVLHLVQGTGMKDIIEIQLRNGELITSTSGHPFYDEKLNNWITASELSVDNFLLSYYDEVLNIEKVRSYKKVTNVFNLTVETNHNFFVGKSRVLSHNTDLCNIVIGAVSKGKNFKEHFLSKRTLLGSITGKNYRKLKTHSQEFLDDLLGLVNNGTVKYVGRGTVNKGQAVLHIYRGNGVTLLLKNNNEFVTLLKSGVGMDLKLMKVN